MLFRQIASVAVLSWLYVLLHATNVANAGIVSGTIDSNSTKKVVVKPSGDKPKQTFTVPEDVTVTIDGKAAKASDLKEGLQISVFTTSSGNVTKLVARTGSSSSLPTTTTSAEPKVSKSKKAEKSKDSNDDDGSSSIGGDTGDSPQFRGPNRDGHANGNKIAKSWTGQGPRLDWNTPGLGEGYAAVAVSRGRIYSMGLLANDEKVLAMDERTGRPQWGVSTGGEPFRENMGNGPRSVPTVDGDRVYALGCYGDLVCLDAKSGQRRWHKNILKESGFRDRTITWGISESPLIDGEKLIVTPGGQEATMVALNKNTGELIWRCKVQGNPGPAYSSAIAIDVGGVRQYVNFTQRAVIGVRAEDGEFLWENRSAANGTANCSAPLFYDSHLFYASGYGTGGACLRLESNGNSTRAEELYKSREMVNHHGGMVIVDGFLYGCDEKILTCLNVQTGKVAWRDRSVGKGAITLVDGMLILRSEQGPVALIEANSTRYVERGRFDQPRRSDKPSWAYPVVANGRLFLRDLDNLFCYDLRR